MAQGRPMSDFLPESSSLWNVGSFPDAHARLELGRAESGHALECVRERKRVLVADLLRDVLDLR
jgi:hypothetical protein